MSIGISNWLGSPVHVTSAMRKEQALVSRPVLTAEQKLAGKAAQAATQEAQIAAETAKVLPQAAKAPGFWGKHVAPHLPAMPTWAKGTVGETAFAQKHALELKSTLALNSIRGAAVEGSARYTLVEGAKDGLKFATKIPKSLGLITAALETAMQLPAVVEGFKEGRGLAQTAKSATVVAGVTAGTMAGTGIGAVVGGAVGGFIGSFFAGVGAIPGAAIGAKVGAWIGGAVGAIKGGKAGNAIGSGLFGSNKGAEPTAENQQIAQQVAPQQQRFLSQTTGQQDKQLQMMQNAGFNFEPLPPLSIQ